ncbi:MAG: cytochrome c oxidase subunit II [Alteromonadaceae bacterium]|nr:cytochrome c oxidase subunit II [Alteromonadaceae bacterium]
MSKVTERSTPANDSGADLGNLSQALSQVFSQPPRPQSHRKHIASPTTAAGRQGLKHLTGGTFALLLAGCGGDQSALAPAGAAAREIATLWWWMFGAATLIFAVVLFLLLYASLVPAGRRRAVPPRKLIIGGGIVFPVIALSLLLLLGINVGSSMSDSTPADTLKIRITGYQWWWEAEYFLEGDASSFVTANELYLPVGRQAELILESADVIHSFWLPKLAGKKDLIPGMTNRLVVNAEEPGIFRGQCAEYCGTAHAKMAFAAVAVSPDEFEAWAFRQSQPQPDEMNEHPGARLFKENGCGLCHTVRGHAAQGKEAPDLTHVGSRKTIAAGVLEMTPRNVARWLAHNNEIKPGNKMPEYQYLDLGSRLAIGDYLESLK